MLWFPFPKHTQIRPFPPLLPIVVIVFSTHFPLRNVGYIFQVTGKKAATPFVIADLYSIGEINSGLSVEVPAEILAAVKAQP
jgi:hypothetical protein